MGYTHYFEQNRPFTDAEWEVITRIARTLYEHLPPTTDTAGGYYKDHPLSIRDWDGRGGPEFSDENIRFNGDAGRSLDHETFALTKKHNPSFNFCKTDRKPYDLMVCAVLIVANHYAPDALTIGSDGDWQDWMPALTFARSAADDLRFELPHNISSED